LRGSSAIGVDTKQRRGLSRSAPSASGSLLVLRTPHTAGSKCRSCRATTIATSHTTWPVGNRVLSIGSSPVAPPRLVPLGPPAWWLCHFRRHPAAQRLAPQSSRSRCTAGDLEFLILSQ